MSETRIEIDESSSIEPGSLCRNRPEIVKIQQYAGLDIVKELIESCHLDKGQYVLDVGCGIGTTSSLLAKFGCRVVGVDISQEMIYWAGKRAREESVDDRVEFKIADAEELPFAGAIFDIVISRFVLAFVNDRARAVNEFVRVVKPGGYVCVNESSWLKTPVPTYLINDFHRTEETVQLLSVSDCKELLSGAGLKDITAKTYQFGYQDELASDTRRGFSERILKIFIPVFKNTTYQQWVNNAQSPKSVAEYYGYGLYSGRK